jgi:hypothetical protein
VAVGRNVVQRKSSESTLSLEWTPEDPNSSPPTSDRPHCACGWPKNLLLPRGTAQGTEFDLFVMVTDGSKDQPTEEDADEVSSDNDNTMDSDSCSYSHILCGKTGNNKYPDNRPMGYPFDRRPYSIIGNASGRIGGNVRSVSNLDEFVQGIGNMKTIRVMKHAHLKLFKFQSNSFHYCLTTGPDIPQRGTKGENCQQSN